MQEMYIITQRVVSTATLVVWAPDIVTAQKIAYDKTRDQTAEWENAPVEESWTCERVITDG